MTEAKLAEQGRSVAARLKRTKGVETVVGIGIDLFVARDFLDRDACAALIATIGQGLRPSSILAVEGEDPGFRTSESCDLDRWHPLVEGVDRRICALLGLKARQGETLQGQRYAPGQQFKPHHDFFATDLPYWQTEKARGGQRSWTAMIYLDQPDAGGETCFTKAGLTVSPRTGMLLAWNNMARDGQPNQHSMHEGVPVQSGVKTIVTKWFRERYWC